MTYALLAFLIAGSGLLFFWRGRSKYHFDPDGRMLTEQLRALGWPVLREEELRHAIGAGRVNER
jgi:hypothetical protein